MGDLCRGMKAARRLRGGGLIAEAGEEGNNVANLVLVEDFTDIRRYRGEVRDSFVDFRREQRYGSDVTSRTGITCTMAAVA